MGKWAMGNGMDNGMGHRMANRTDRFIVECSSQWRAITTSVNELPERLPPLERRVQRTTRGTTLIMWSGRVRCQDVQTQRGYTHADKNAAVVVTRTHLCLMTE